MTLTRESVLEWLAETRRSQSWLAQQCGVSDQAVSNWLREKNPRPISAAATLIIAALMDADRASSPERPAQNLVLEFTDEEFANIGRAALLSNELVPDYAKRVLNEIAQEDLHALVEQHRAATALRVAEQPKPYGRQRNGGE